MKLQEYFKTNEEAVSIRVPFWAWEKTYKVKHSVFKTIYYVGFSDKKWVTKKEIVTLDKKFAAKVYLETVEKIYGRSN